MTTVENQLAAIDLLVAIVLREANVSKKIREEKTSSLIK